MGLQSWREGRLSWRGAVSLLIVFLGLCRAPGIAATSLEYRVKAAFLYNFTKFVEWPASAFPSATTPFSVCLVGAEPFGDEVARILADRAVQSRPILVRHVAPDQRLPLCHMLVLAGPAERRHSSTLLAATANSPTLSVGEGADFLERGGCIRFLLVEGRVKFEINRAAVDRAGLKVSSKLLRLGHTAGGGL